MTVAAPAKLLDAIKRDDAATVAVALLQQPALAEQRGPQGESLVLHALYVNAQTVLPTLTATRTLPAVEAAALGNVRALREALETNAGSIASWSGDGWTPLHLAAFFGRAEAVQILLDAGASHAELSRNMLANTPLHAALAGAANAEVVAALIAAGADVNARGAREITPLHVAASRGSRPLCDALLAAGADRTVRMDDGKTPSQLAASRNFAELAAHLA